MAKKLFVGGLSWDTTDASLRKAFESHGEVREAKVITDRDTGRSRGFGFVTFLWDEDAKKAISNVLMAEGHRILRNVNISVARCKLAPNPNHLGINASPCTFCRP